MNRTLPLLTRHVFEFLAAFGSCPYVLTYVPRIPACVPVRCPGIGSVRWHDALRDVLSVPRSYGIGHSNRPVTVPLRDVYRFDRKDQFERAFAIRRLHVRAHRVHTPADSLLDL